MNEGIQTIQGVSTCEEVIRKSRFVAAGARADSAEEAMAFLQQVRDPEATHNCWAYRIGEVYRFSDDGEPGGTAGRPIFMAIDHQQMDRIVVVVTRYFGGIKLGTGGLARAYGGLAARCLQNAVRHVIQKQMICRLDVPFVHTGTAYHLLDTHAEIEKLNEQFEETGIRFTLRIPSAGWQSFKTRVQDTGSGAISLTMLEIVEL